MGHYGIITFRFKWTIKAFLVLLLVVSVSGTPFMTLDSSKANSNDNSYSPENQTIDTPEAFDTSILSSDYQEVNTTASLGLHADC